MPDQIIIVFRDMCTECDEQVGLPHTSDCTHEGKVTKAQSTEKGTTPEGAHESHERLMRINMATRLRAMAGALEVMTAADEQTVKLIFDLKGAARHLDQLDELLDAIEDWERTTPGAQRSSILELAATIRDEKSKGSDPEPKIA